MTTGGNAIAFGSRRAMSRNMLRCYASCWRALIRSGAAATRSSVEHAALATRTKEIRGGAENDPDHGSASCHRLCVHRYLRMRQRLTAKLDEARGASR